MNEQVLTSENNPVDSTQESFLLIYQLSYYEIVIYPVKHKTLYHCWFNVGPPSTMLVQH